MNLNSENLLTEDKLQVIDLTTITPELLLGQNELVIRPVVNSAEMRMVYRLVHDCFVEKGYATVQPNGLLKHYSEWDGIPETTVLIAILHGEVVGTFSYTIDGPRKFMMDNDFPEECAAVRHEGRPVCAGWRLAVKSSCRAQRRILLGLIKEMIRRAMREEAESCLISARPNHVGFYRRALNMTVIGRKTIPLGPSLVPAILLRCDRETLPPYWITEPSAARLWATLEFQKTFNYVSQLASFLQNAPTNAMAVWAFRLLTAALLKNQPPSI